MASSTINSSKKDEMEQEEGDPYMLGRDYVASGRLAMLHLLIHAQFGYLLHPSITNSLPQGNKTEGLKIADVGTGTGIFVGELTREFPSSTRFSGFDISPAQYPPSEWYGPNTELQTLDVYKPLPEELRGKFDIVCLRFFMTISSDRDVNFVVENLRGMLKPGGYLQWVERDWLSKFPKTASAEDAANMQLGAFLNGVMPNREWINDIPAHFQKAGLEVIGYEHEPPLPMYRKPWNEDNLIGTAAIADKLPDPKKREWYKDNHAKAATECAKGWYVDFELVICVGRKGAGGE